jgi:hypothetical protein
VDLGQQAADPVRRCGGLLGQGVVEAAEHGQFGELFVGALDRARGMGHGPGRFGDDERVPGVGFRCSGSPGFRAAWPRRWARLCRRASSRTGRVHGNGVFGLADIQADEDINVFVVSDHLYLPVTAADTSAGLSAVSEPGIHVTHDDPNLSGLY